MIYVVIPVLNQLEYTKNCLKTLRSDNYQLYVIVIDNASTDGTFEYFKNINKNELDKSIVKIQFVRNKVPLSVAASWNQGLERAFLEKRANYVLISNNDVLFHPKTIDNLVDSFKKCEDKSVVMFTACNVKDQLKDPWDIVKVEPDIIGSVSPHPDFSCFMMNKDCFYKVGLFDENYRKAYFEDNDYHLRIKRRGLKALATTRAPFYHFGSKTQNQVKEGVVTSKDFENNRSYFISKWQASPEELGV